MRAIYRIVVQDWSKPDAPAEITVGRFGELDVDDTKRRAGLAAAHNVP